MTQTNKTRSFSGWLHRSAVWLTLIPVLLSMWMIFGFSAQSAEQSNATSGRLVALAIRLFVPDYERLPEARQAEITQLTTLVVRKAAHATEYAALGFFLQLHVTAWRRRRGRGARWIWTLAAGLLYAITDELHQGFVADRAPRIADVAIDTAGVLAGIAVCGLVLWIVRRIRLRKGEKHRAA
ncbi:MAG: VanZ family protein [Clostridia bacterium]|nr:VanZ family protein [Clostridia bacterium]